jgi:MarR family transcriptional regulator, organic hydroperoxide resistance regulator
MEPGLDTKSPSEQLDAQIVDGLGELIGRIVARGERLARDLGIPSYFVKALHTLNCPMAMKDLGQRMHCDPSFVTVVADMLEKRGLARREAHPGDRRVKNLVLTDAGLTLKQRVESELATRMPWSRALSVSEREQLLALIRKMINADDGAPSPEAPAEEVAAVVSAPAGSG